MNRNSISRLALFGAVGLLACSSQEAPDGSVHGELRIANLSFDDGHSEREFFLAADGSERLTRLIFAREPEVPAQTQLKVWGSFEGKNLMVDRFEVDASKPAVVAEVEEPLLNGTRRTRTVGFVIMNTGSTPNLTTAQAQTAAFGTRTPNDASLRDYYLEASFNTLEFTGQVFQTNATIPAQCDTGDLMDIAQTWPSQFGVTMNHWMGYIGTRASACGWGGVGWEGTAQTAQSVSFYNATAGCVVLAQEIGHNLGWMHAGTMDCGTQILADNPTPPTCTGDEYGSRITPMGGACLHLNAYDKWYRGFFGGCNAVRASASGTFTLLPIELPCDGLQAIQVPMQKTRMFRNSSGGNNVSINRYYLELRTKRGLDDKSAVPGPRVFVHVAGDVPAANGRTTFDWVLDMDPTTNGFDGMNVGQTFNDPGGSVSFTVQAMDNDRATIVVTAPGTGSPTCMDGTTFTAPGPTSCGTSTGGTGGMGGMGAGGMGGRGGAGGMGGRGGMPGTAGRGGAPAGGMGGAPQAGSGGDGVAGTPGGGEAGAAGLGGAAGSTPIAGGGGLLAAGAAGTPVTGGAGAGVSGSAGAGISGTGGSATGTGGSVAGGAAPVAGTGPAPIEQNAPIEDPGCGCRTVPSNRASSAVWALSLLALGLIRRRRAR